MLSRLQPSRRKRGFTLIELMVVVAILSLLAGFGSFVGNRVRVQGTAVLARGVLYAAARARAAAITDGYQRRLYCASRGCGIQRASDAGMAPPNPTWAWESDYVNAAAGTQVAGMDATTDVGTATPAGFKTSAITFFPDGSASPSTVFVSDASSASRYKVYVYSTTGLARMVDTW